MATDLLSTPAMKLFLLAALVGAVTLVHAGVGDEASPSELNVNSRYTVESVELAPQHDYTLSSTLLTEMHQLIGEHLNMEALERLSRRLTEELRATNVTFRVYRGNEPARVRVAFDVEKRVTNFDVSLSRLTYNSVQGWSGTGQVTATFGANALTLAGMSNGDDLVERYSGIRARYDRLNGGSQRVRVGFEFDDFREQYDGATLNAMRAGQDSSSLGAGAYRSRMNFEPGATFLLAKPLTLTVGMSFESVQPDSPGAKAEAANALVATLRYRRRSEGADANSYDLDAAYRLRTATGFLGSDSLYTKHVGTARYLYRHRRQSMELTVLAGLIAGRAPLFERFVAGNNNTLRGWNKYELDPLGGNRMATASVTYGYRMLRLFYDAGSLWDRGTTPELKHSVGAGITTGMGLFGKDAVLLAFAFPIRQGRVEPVFIAGMDF